jgi:hypothetical protein
MSNYYYMDENSGDAGCDEVWEGRFYAFALCPKLDDRGERKYILSCDSLQERERWKYALMNPFVQTSASGSGGHGPKGRSAQNESGCKADSSSLDEEWLQQQADGA